MSSGDGNTSGDGNGQQRTSGDGAGSRWGNNNSNSRNNRNGNNNRRFGHQGRSTHGAPTSHALTGREPEMQGHIYDMSTQSRKILRAHIRVPPYAKKYQPLPSETAQPP